MQRAAENGNGCRTGLRLIVGADAPATAGDDLSAAIRDAARALDQLAIRLPEADVLRRPMAALASVLDLRLQSGRARRAAPARSRPAL